MDVDIPTTALEVAALQRDAEADAAVFASAALAIDTADDYATVDAALTSVVTRKDAAIAMRKRATVPMYTAIREVESWFRPLVTALERAEGALKGAMGTYRLAQANAERTARDAAAHAAETGDADALVASLNAANDAAGAGAAGRATTSFAWVVERIAEDLVPREWWCVDRARIDAMAKAYKGDDAPVIPGVIFRRVAKIGARR